MKTLKRILALWSVFLGAVVGAGFLSGSELVAFFGGDNVWYIALSGALFLIALTPVYGLNGKFESLPLAVEKLTGGKKAFNAAVVSSAFIFFTGMLAGLDALGQTFGLNFPLFSLSAIFVVASLARYGVSGLEKLNLFLMPVVIILVNAVILKGDFSFENAQTLDSSNVGNVFLYVTMNAFVATPALFGAAKGKSKTELITSAVLSVITLCIEAFLILRVIYSTEGAKTADLPLLYAVDGWGKYALFTALLLGTLTSLACSFHPVYEFVKGKFRRAGVFTVCALAFVLSRMGLGAVVKYLYPVIGGMGAVFIITLGVGFVKEIWNEKRKGKFK